jgi:hypothetical protein
MTLHRRVVGLGSFLGMLVLLAIPAAAAYNNKATASVPFAFWVGATQFEAGDYSLETLEPGVAFIKSVSGGPQSQAQVFLVPDGDSKPVANPVLTFVYRDGHFSLLSISDADGNYVVSEMSAIPQGNDEEVRTVALTAPSK